MILLSIPRIRKHLKMKNPRGCFILRERLFVYTERLYKLRNIVTIPKNNNCAQYARLSQINGRVPRSPESTNRPPIRVIVFAILDLYVELF